MQKTIICAVLLPLAAIGLAVGQTRRLPYADAVAFLGTEEAAKTLKQAVFAVQVVGEQANTDPHDDWLAIGSGFLVKGGNNEVLGITCHHVATAALKARKPLYIGLDTGNGYRRFPCDLMCVEPNEDIAVIAPRKAPNEFVTLRQKFFSEEMFDDNSSLVEGRAVVIPGYPLALGIEDDKNHPVVRFGLIAQFTGKSTFLIDGFASHGSSGSPVFALKDKEHRLVGMVTSHITDKITLLDESGRISAQIPYNSGLARAVSMKTIAAIIEKADMLTRKDRGQPSTKEE